MANTFAPFGFTPIRRADGATWTGGQSVRKIKSTNTHYFFKGDPVTTLSTGYVDVVAGGTGGSTPITGIFIGCEYLSVAQGKVVWSPVFPGSDTVQDVVAYVIDDPNVLFAVQTANGGSAAAGLSYVGAMAGYNFSLYTNGVPATGGSAGASTSGNTLNGISGTYIDLNGGTPQTTSTLPFRIAEVPNLNSLQGSSFPVLGNGYDPTTQYNIVFVSFNNSDTHAGQTGI